MTNYVIIYLLITNILSFSLMGLDKYFACASMSRLSEKMLLTSALIGGSLGALIGMRAFRHKNRNPKFYILIPTMLIGHIVFINYIFNEK